MFINKKSAQSQSGRIIWLGIFLSYILVGVGVYLWQSSIVKEAKKEQEGVVRQTLLQQNELSQKATLLQKNTQAQLEKIKNNEIDLATVKAGDKLANGMTVGNVLKEGDKTFVEFTGSIVISGNFNYFNLKQSNDLSSAFYGKICVQADKESLIKIPKLDNTWNGPICFSNTDVAKNRFGPPGNQGKALVAIDNFRLRIGDAYPYDEAELIKTIEIIK